MLLDVKHGNDMSHIEVCDLPGDYFVSVIEDGKAVLASGPFPTHQQAIDAVQAAKNVIYKFDVKAPWYAYGTCRLELGSGIVGVLQREGYLDEFGAEKTDG